MPPMPEADLPPSLKSPRKAPPLKCGAGGAGAGAAGADVTLDGVTECDVAGEDATECDVTGADTVGVDATGESVVTGLVTTVVGLGVVGATAGLVAGATAGLVVVAADDVELAGAVVAGTDAFGVDVAGEIGRASCRERVLVAV